jgi:hypothetical protein
VHRTAARATALAVLALTLAACAAGPNTAAAASGPDAAGFWLGLWHGVILPITFIVSLFRSGVGIYEIHNDGAWYDFGFVVGALVVFSGPLSSRRRRARPVRVRGPHTGMPSDPDRLPPRSPG